MRRKLKVRHIIGGLLLLLLLVGCIWQAIMKGKETEKYQPVGEFITVKDHEMHYYRLGQGKDTIVFLGGSGTPCSYTDFDYLQKDLQEVAHTISFDHAGFGWSEETEEPRDVGTLVEELHELLEAMDRPANYILVAHSMASLEAIHYAQVYPEEVQGIVLLDAGSPEFYAETNETTTWLLNRFFAVLRGTGVVRLAGKLGFDVPFVGNEVRANRLPEDMRALDTAMFNNMIGNAENLANIKLIQENAQTVLEKGTLVDIPLLILSSESNVDWGNVQRELLQWSNESKQKMISNSSHYIHWTSRERVVMELLDVIEE